MALYAIAFHSSSYYATSAVPMFMVDDSMALESGGVAFLTVQLVNEIEENFTINYATREVADGASGTYMSVANHHSCT